MRVNNQNATGSAAVETGRTQDTQTSGRGSAGSADSNSDTVEFSSALGGLSRAVSTESAQRSSRVQAVATAYQNGTYRADPRAISRAMISEAASGE
jgi:anti-sigma28 factor (negative regulator of flagellin synthesis)